MKVPEERSEKPVSENRVVADVAGLRLLLVEDDEDSREAMTRLLVKRGLAVTEVVDAQSALEELSAHPFDAVLADVRLPGMNGVDLLVEIRKRDVILPVLLITAYADVTLLRRAVAYNVQDYLLKPLDSIEDALEPLRKAVAHHRLALERDRLEAELRASEEKFRKLFDNANDMMCLYEAPEKDVPGSFLEVNAAVCSHLGYTAEELNRMSPADVMPAESIRAVTESLRQTGANGRAPIECACRARDGSLVPVEIGSHLFELAGKKVILSIARDISERRRAERAIAAAAEEERSRLGRELHDAVCQPLFGLSSGLAKLKRSIEKTRPDDLPHLETLVSLAAQTRMQAAHLAKGLFAFELADEDLGSALAGLAVQTEATYGIPCAYTGCRGIAVADALCRAYLYLIAHEAVANAVAHAKARCIRIEFGPQGAGVALVVRDDGMGVEEGGPARMGTGIRIMLHRAKVVGASIEFRRPRSGGTEVVCVCPLGR